MGANETNFLADGVAEQTRGTAVYYLNLIRRMIRMAPQYWGRCLGDKLRYKPCLFNEGHSFLCNMSACGFPYNNLFTGVVETLRVLIV